MINKILRSLVLVSAFILMGNTANAQDPAFSQFYSNPLYLNPAFAGASLNGCPSAVFNYRDQWPGIGRTYVTYSASYDLHIDGIGGGLGIIVAQTAHPIFERYPFIKITDRFITTRNSINRVIKDLSVAACAKVQLTMCPPTRKLS